MIPHFALEENYIFPILGDDHELVKIALLQHKRLHMLFSETDDPTKSLRFIEEELKEHIRYEEGVLFKKIQIRATETQLQIISKNNNDEKFNDNTDDPFWI